MSAALEPPLSPNSMSVAGASGGQSCRTPAAVFGGPAPSASLTPTPWMTTRKQFATFFLHGFFYGVDVLRVQEVIRNQEVTRVPFAPAMIQGLIHLRGQILTAIDLRRRLSLPVRAEGELPMNMVIRTDEGRISLLVDDVGDVLEVDGSCFERVPGTVTGVARDLILGVYKLQSKLLLILDTERAASLPDSINTLPSGQ